MPSPEGPAPEASSGPRLFVPAMAVVSFALATGVALGPLEGIPHVTDEVAYTWQAGWFSKGQLMGSPPAAPSMMIYPFLDADPGLHAAFPPGWPALLALGIRFHLELLVNPLCAALATLLTAAWARRWELEPRAVRLAVAVVALSPGVVVLAASRMSHSSVLVAALLAVWGASQPRLGPARALSVGMAWAYIVVARPFDAVLIGVFVVALLARWRARAASWAVVGGCLAAATAAVLAYNHQVTGDPWTFPATDWYAGFVPDRPGCNRLGFGPDVGCAPAIGGSPGYSLQEGLAQLLHGLLVYDRLLLGLPGGLLFGVWGLVALRRREPFLVLPVLLLPLGYLLYWSPGVAYGARFLHPLYLAVPLGLAVFLHRYLGRWSWVPVVALPAVGLSRAVPELADRYWCVDDGLARTLEERGIEDAVVFLDARGQRRVAWSYLGVPGFVCDAMLEAGDGFAVSGPAAGDRWLFRHLPGDLQQARAWLRDVAPEREAWVARHRVDLDRRQIVALPAALEEEPMRRDTDTGRAGTP